MGFRYLVTARAMNERVPSLCERYHQALVQDDLVLKIAMIKFNVQQL